MMRRFPPGLLLASLLTAAAMQAAVGEEATRVTPVVDAIMEIRIDPVARTLEGAGRWILPRGRSWEVLLNDRFEVTDFRVEGVARAPDAAGRAGLRRWQLPAMAADRRLEIRWRGVLDPLNDNVDHRGVVTRTAPVAGPRGAFLAESTYWHPVLPGVGLDYQVAIDTPSDQLAVVPGTPAGEEVSAGRRVQRYEFRQPESAVTLMSGPYRVLQREHRSVDGRSLLLRALLHPEIAGQGADDLEAVARYVARYEAQIGAYPYETFSIVSSPTPTGFGFPTLTYMGVDVLRLPFIRGSSLGHEVLHNWWGNGVRPDYAKGNWSEGLTTFMADYAFREDAGAEAALETRVGWLRDFAALGATTDKPLIDFRSRTHGAEQVIGYNKAAMLFLMLRDAIGRDAFERALQQFWLSHRGETASWDDLRRAFERVSRRDLQVWFGQWLTRSGAPELKLASAGTARVGEHWRVDVRVTQGDPAYRLRLPLVLSLEDGTQRTRWIELDGVQQSYSLEAELRPVAVTLDPEARVFRRLAPGEAPPILRQAMLDPATVTVLVGAEQAGAALARRLVEHPLRTQDPASAIPSAPLLLIGLRSEVEPYLQRAGLPGRPAELGDVPAAASALVWTAERPGSGPVTVVAARDEQALGELMRPLPHYGRQSWLVFSGPKVLERGVWPLRAQEIRLRAPPRPAED
jgi:hypothetical protein